MLKDELHSNIDNQSFFEKYFGLGVKTFIIALFSVIGLGLYISVLLFGDNSLEVLMRLDEYKSYLNDEIDSIKKENASLQKEFFELKELEAN
jgi:cell division protein FtsB